MASSKASIAFSSLQEQKEQVIDVVFLCDEWKSSKGGLSTFNREFAINLAETTTNSMKIHCYVSKSDDQEKEDARQYGVNLITARSIPGSIDSLECLKFPPQELPNPHLVIGHGRKFGRCAYFLVQATKCQWIQFVHVYCEDLGKYKKPTMADKDLIEENEKKHKMEIELCKAADAVVAVGSRLQQKYSGNLPTVQVEIVTPGIFEKFSCESQFALHRLVKNFRVFLFGRATFEDLSLKGYDIVANAIGSLGKNFTLTFVGSPPGEHTKVEEWFLGNTCINRNQLTIRGYCSDPEELKTMFYQSDLVALPSRTEGFGLVALEAISAGVPILVSGESGIAEALEKVEGGNTVIVESDEDVGEWAQRITETSAESTEEREANAKRLRENYRKVYSWRTECARFRRMIENVMKTANDEDLNIKVEAEECKPKETNMPTTTVPTESGGCQGVQYQRVSTMLPTEGSLSQLETEDPQALKDRVLCSIAMNYLKTTPPQSIEEHNMFKEYLREIRVIFTSASLGSLVISVKCESLQILEKLWTDYSSGHLGKMVQNCFVTEKILKEFKLTELKLKTTMDVEEYKARKVYFERVALRDALRSQSYFKSSEGREPHLEKWKEKKEVAKSEKMKDALRFQSYFKSSEGREPHLEKWKAKIEVAKSEKMKDALRFQSYFKSSEGREPHLEKWKAKIEVAKSEKMKGEFLEQGSRLQAAEKPKKDLPSMFRSRRPRSSRSLEQEKIIAQTFVKFLEDNNRKEDMFVDELRQIYQGEFRRLYDTLGMSFSKILNTLTYHINACQQLQDRVIFGGGEAAALTLLTDDSDDSDDDLCYRSPSSLSPFYCNICKRDLGDDRAYSKHIEGVKHRQQYILITIRKSLKKPELVFDKNGIRVTSDPAADEHGVIELKVESGKYGQIVLIIENLSKEDITLKDITLLWSVNFFDYSEISNIGFFEGQLHPGCQRRFRIGCKHRREFGYSYVPGVLTFQTEDGVEFHILRFFSVRIVSDLYDDLKQTSQYKPPQRATEIPRDVKTFEGIPLPRLQRNGLIMVKLDVHEIPLTVKAQVIKSNQIREGLCERLKKNLSFDIYKEKFSLLLHVEELQMQKDIRNYDMKGVVFQQERGDRRFLILEVPGLAENRPSVLRGDKIYAYEPGVLQRRYEGIVHKVQMLDVKLGFDMNDMPYVKGKKFDIQFTFHRLAVQMEHRACERIASVNRQDMRHVLFPSEDCLDQRGEIYKEISFFYDRNLNSKQEQAVQKIVSGSSRPAPYLVFGPPGTGKTVTLVEAIKQVHALIGSSYILACSPENSAADLLAERLLPHVDKGRLFRIYAASRPWDFVPQKLKDARVVNFDPVIREVYFPSKEELMSDYRIIVTTLVTAGRLVSALFPRDHFTHIFIDEAGHATEPECIIPVTDLLDPYNPRGGQLVLAGDPKQLGPILRSPISQKYGLETSLLERLMTSCPVYDRGPRGSYNPNLLTKLVNNYRSHRTIIEIPKQLFYENELHECAGDFRNVMIGWEELPNENFPIIFHPVFGKDEREGSSPSFFNVAEVETIERYLRKLLDDNVRSRGIKHLKPEMIGVISPYRRQVQKIQKMIEKRRFGGEIKVGSVEEFQGQERRVIILSTVRSTKKEYLEMDKDFRLGFLNNPKRFNVAITRAQALLILIGNPDMLYLDENWKTFVDYCGENKATVDVERKEKVEDIAGTLKRLKLLSSAASEYDEDSEISQRQLQEHPEWTRRE